MSEDRITPRAAAFPPRPDPVPSAAEPASQFATHGDPSLAPAGAPGRSRPGGVSVEWVYAAELTNRLAARGMTAAAEVHLRAHAWLREQGRRGRAVPAPGSDALPPRTEFGRTAPERRATGRPPIG